MIPVIRLMHVVRAPGTDDKPAIHLTNKWLTEAGFTMGTAIEVSYQSGIITVKKINHENRLLTQKIPVANSDGGAEDGH